MVSLETTKPFQFGLRSIFLVTAAVGVALSLLKSLGPRESLAVMFFTAPIAAAIAILVKSKGTAWPGMFVGEALSMIMAIPLFDIHGFGGRIVFAFACMVGFAAWTGGGIAADAESKRRSFFLRWSWFLASIWLLIAAVIGTLAELKTILS